MPAGGAILPSRFARFAGHAAPWRLGFTGGAVIAALILAAGVLHASEYGVGSYRPGTLDLFAGMLPAPGGVLIKNYFLFQDASLDAQPENTPLRVHTHTVTYTNATFVTYTTPLRVVVANWGVAALAQKRIANKKQRVTPNRGSPLRVNARRLEDFGDLIVSPLMLNWNFSKFHLLGALMFYAPTGSYDRRRIIDIGLNRWAIEPDLGVTWLDNETGRHASLFAGYTVNAENPSTHYLSGQRSSHAVDSSCSVRGICRTDWLRELPATPFNRPLPTPAVARRLEHSKGG